MNILSKKGHFGRKTAKLHIQNTAIAGKGTNIF
jgi:hypothetical protein